MGKVVEHLQISQLHPPPEIIFDQALTYFDLPVCPVTQGLVHFYQLNTYNLKK
jgi:hypothetical protein